LLLFREVIVDVIPGRAEGASPESITPGGAIVYYVYILASRKHGTLYIGVTNDLVRRVYEHRTDAVRGFTSRYGVHLLVWFESYDDVANAIAREKEFKKWRREWKINLIEHGNPNWGRSLRIACKLEPLRRHSGARPKAERPESMTTGQGLWIPALAEPVIGPRFARTRWLGRNDGGEIRAAE
jgi:putative endonuclease